MSRIIGVLVICVLGAALAGCSSCSGNDTADDGGTGDGVGSTPCEPPAWASPEWRDQHPVTGEHVIDGLFGDGEWEGAERLEGVFTDLYLDYREPNLYVLNDWRVNEGGIRDECFNEFRLGFGVNDTVLRVYGDGHVTINNSELTGEGAYGFSSSPNWSTPHTIWEFRLEVPAGAIAVCPIDPKYGPENCDELTEEPVVFAISTGASGIRVARVPHVGVAEHAEGETCGHGEGICSEGLSCVEEGGAATCVEQDTPGPDADAVSDAPTDVTEEMPADVPDAASDVDFPDEPSPDAADPDGYGEDGPS